MFKQRNITTLFILGAICVAVMFTTSYTSQKHIRELQATFISSSEGPSWISASLTLEHSRLIQALAKFSNDEPGITKQTLQERLDIYWSKYDLLSAEAANYYKILNKPDISGLPANTQSDTLELATNRLRNNGIPTLIHVEALIDQLTSPDDHAYHQILDVLDTLAQDVTLLQVAAFEYDHYLDLARVALSKQLRHRLRSAYISIALGIGLVGLVLLMNLRQIKRTAKKLRSFNKKLVAEVRESARLTSELEYRVTHDDLSGLLNRFGFKQSVGDILSAGVGEHGICFIDLDMFKIVNDSSGHAAGDALIQQIAYTLTRHMPESGRVARFGGDEFILLLPDCERDEFEELVTRCLGELRPLRFNFEGKSFDITASFGAVHFDAASYDTQSLMAEADAACYEAKRAGGARVHFHSRDCAGYADTRRSDLRWVAKLQHALNEDRFCLLYQPVTALQHTGEYSADSWEVLIRMIEPDGTVLPPGNFLEIAERYALAPRLDRWVIDHVFDWLKVNSVWANELNGININLSGRSVGDPELLSYIEFATRALPVDTRKICFEITETAVVGEHAMKFLERLKELGYQLALDDFGAGFSSFGYLESLPVDYIKIDGLFVRDIDQNQAHLEFVKAIDTVGKAMGKKTVAEYVQNQASVDILQTLGIDYAQGYYIGEPAPLPDSVQWQQQSLPTAAPHHVKPYQESSLTLVPQSATN